MTAVTPSAALDLVCTLVSAMELTPGVAIHGIGRDGRVTYWNNRCAELFGVPAREALGQPVSSLFSHPGHDGDYVAHLQRIFSTGEATRVADWQIGLRDGSTRWISGTAFPLIRDGRVDHVFCMDYDITGRKASERNLLLSAQVFEHSRDAIMITDAQYRIVTVNGAFTDITGFTALEVAGQEAQAYNDGLRDHALVEQIREHVAHHGHWSGELWSRRRDGTPLPLAMTVTAIRDGHGAVNSYMAIMSDITERKRLEEETRHLAEHDYLTGLPNRVLFRDRLQQALATARRKMSQVAVLYMDLDRFKEINDTHGHAVGDIVLREVAARLARCVRSVDTVSRQGGDEFVVMLADIGSAEHAAHVASTMMKSVLAVTQAGGVDVALSVSIGIALYPVDGPDIDTLFKHADVAMYHAKEGGRNGYRFFSPQMNEHVSERIEMENSLRKALQNGEFELEFQPDVDIASSRTIALEALIRWRHPERGLLMPDQFLAAAEETGLSVPIGEWVLQLACRQARAWHDAGYPVAVSVNLSGLQFLHPDLLRNVDAALENAGLAPEFLELEITEGVIMKGNQAAMDTIRALRGRGVHITIDDFGTGYSSLGGMRQLAVSKLKIDRSFIEEIGAEGPHGEIIPAIIALARSMNLKVVAEGVENERELQYLRQQGCDEFQGHYAAIIAGQPRAG
ncbi:putative bifunctional diguanylate cyclase/phosphodiesterase [Pseudoduganella sp. GCM10020061]|uniref:putative bifunctional diguanylate cyclase/phosphodiesterase n=1 Tax=Pseudoduganella sp. GCM10020061 TaxID=3317345 RepID=UPI00362D0E09